MAKVRCTLINASEEINGIAFAPAEDGKGMVSEDISPEIAANFAEIDGYEIVDASPLKEAPAKKPKELKPEEPQA